MRTRGLLLAALFAPALVLAQDEGAGAPPGRAAKEPRRVLDRIVQILDDSAQGDPKTTVSGLRDASWAVRAFSAIRMGVLGLDEATVRSLRDGSRPGSKPPAADDKKVAAAETFASSLKPTDDKKGDKKATVGDEGIRIYASLIRNELSVKRAPPDELRAVIVALPDFADAAEDNRAKEFIARELLELSDEPQVLKELALKDRKAAVAENGKKLYEWFRSNEKYLYLHPKEGALHVDAAARSDGTPSAEYRQKHPWGADEGPNAPPRKGHDTR